MAELETCVECGARGVNAGICPNAVNHVNRPAPEAPAEALTEKPSQERSAAVEDAPVAPAEPTIDHVITQEDLDMNPGLENDVKVGDVVTLPEPVELEKLTKAELLEIAERSHIEVASSDTKTEIIEKIHASHESAPENEPAPEE